MTPQVFVAVGGMPASGKSTVAALLAPALGLPLLAKDTIKHGLMDALGDPIEIERSRELGRAAVYAMLAVAAANTGAVLDSTWYPYAEPLLRALPSPVVQVRCRCSVEVARRRHRARMPTRRTGDLQAIRPDDELWSDVHRTPLAVGPVVDVDTERSVDAETLAADVLAWLG
ncbi:MAG TPA: AAA family ATPase [Euzebyales bacterium]